MIVNAVYQRWLIEFYGALYVDMCRFTPEEKAKRHPCAYMPFGYGPRNCIGMRFALLQAKMALIEIVSKFRIVLAPETKVKWLCNTVLYCSCFLQHVPIA